MKKFMVLLLVVMIFGFILFPLSLGAEEIKRALGPRVISLGW